ncbi:chromate efflux transporter [Shewanella dokdonensis]|uniref:Chromate efflux transporter n=1 Tax=Shewanella dokdonensis TaxID=712036 RepID=A0ABX8DEL4_9GAMM|nr:chromate efflux transporter [Shewanella dokdonensis]MCL1074616.1 chromate efflux transporter [Shewanella dokdonensis]QVK22377.1 chromate efflux transporter [Shewanella dokdonensis]
MWQIFIRFLLLGLVSFGGPAAHIGYFRRVFVEELHWLDEQQYAATVALCQFLPGPGSSQVGFSLGYLRGGLPGAIAAFIGFTLPSFLLMYLLARFGLVLSGQPLVAAAIEGLKLLAVVVVADAVISMARQYCQQRVTATITLLTAAIVLLLPFAVVQLLVLLLAALLGRLACRTDTASSGFSSANIRWWPLWLFGVLLLLSFSGSGIWQLCSDFYQTGALVFGGGHVVLPLLQSRVAGNMDADLFLSGYALAQAVPGPMFSLAAFLGAELWQSQPLIGALLATCAIFLPGFLLVLAFNRGWQALQQRPNIAAAIAGINAAVVGLLLSALYQPVFVSAVQQPWQMALVVVGMLLLRLWKLHIVYLILGCISVSILITLIK